MMMSNSFYLYLPERLDAILCGFDKEWRLVCPCDVNQPSVVVNDPSMDSSSANARLLQQQDANI